MDQRTPDTAAVVAAVAIIASAVMLLAPGLALLAVPFLVGLWLRRRGKRGGLVALLLGGLLYSGIAVNFVLASDDFAWEVADYVGVLVGGVAAIVTAAASAAALARRRAGAST